MVNMDKIRTMAKENKRSLSYLVSAIGLNSRTYFNDVEKYGRDIPDKYLSIIAKELNTTVAYLRDETDVKEKPSANSEELNLDKNTIVVRGRDGSVETKTLTDKQFHALQVIIDQFADAPDDL